MSGRRQFIQGGLFALSSALAPSVFARTNDGSATLAPGEQSSDIVDAPTIAGIIEEINDEVSPWSDFPMRLATAQRILSYAPKTTHPFAVAKYFLSIARGEDPDIGARALAQYKDEFQPNWPYYLQEEVPIDINDRSKGVYSHENPLIVIFFQETQLDSYLATDETAWCAAFMNWCVVNSYVGRQDKSSLPAPPRHGLASRFSQFAEETTQPKCGDIAVFRREYSNSRGERKVGGHVGFYLGEAPNDHVKIFGGNQGNQLKISNYPKLGRLGSAQYTLTSYRTIPQIDNERPLCPTQ